MENSGLIDEWLLVLYAVNKELESDISIMRDVFVGKHRGIWGRRL